MSRHAFTGDVERESRGGFTKKDIVFLLIIVLSLGVVIYFKANQSSAPVPEAFAQKISLEDATLQSAETGKPILVFATASWCGPCQAFKRGPLSDPEVSEAITNNTIPVYLDIDEHPSEAGMFGVQSIPTLLILESGEITARSGAMSERSLIDWISAAADEQGVSSGG